MIFFILRIFSIFYILNVADLFLFGQEYDFELEAEETPQIYSGPSKDSLGNKFHSPWEVNPNLFNIPRAATEINVQTERKWSRRYLVLPLMLATFLGFGSGSEIQGDMSTFGPSLMGDLFGWGMVIPGSILHSIYYDTYGSDFEMIWGDLKKFFPTEDEDGNGAANGNDGDGDAPVSSPPPGSLLRDPYGYNSYRIGGILAGQDGGGVPGGVVDPVDPVDEEEEEEDEYVIPDEFYEAMQYSVGTVFMILGSVSLIISRIRQIAAIPVFYEKEISLRTLLEKKRREQTSIYHRSKHWNHYTQMQTVKPIWKGMVFSNGVSASGSMSFRLGGIFSLRIR